MKIKKVIRREMKRRIRTGTNPLIVAKSMATYIKVKKGLRN